MRRMLLLLLIVFLWEAPMAVAEEGARYRYVGWVKNETLSIQEPDPDSSEGWMRVGKDASWRAEFCEAKSDYICFISPLHAFAVAKRFDPAVREWTVRGIKFELVDEDLTVSIFGRRRTGLFLIKTAPEATLLGQETGSPAYSLFSPKDGLVAFFVDREVRTYWIEGERGFGASRGEAAHPNAPAEKEDSRSPS